MRDAARVMACIVLVHLACLPPTARAPDNVVDAQYRLTAPLRDAHSTATSIYRWVGERSLAVPSRCKMLPTDSQAFALRAQSCGGAATWYWAVARLLLEQGGSPRFLPAVRLDGRLRWIDVPGPCE